MTRKKKIPFLPLLLTFLALLCGLALGACSHYLDQKHNQAFETYADSLFRQEILTSTINLHYTLAFPEQYGIQDPTPSLSFPGADDSSRRRRALEDQLEDLKNLSSRRLSHSNRIALDTLRLVTGTELSSTGMELLQEPLSPSLGIQAQLPVLLAEYTFRTRQDIEDYLQLLSLTDSYFRQILDFEQEKAVQGLFMSDASLCRIQEQCRSLISDPSHNYLESIFSDKISAFPDLTVREKNGYLNRHREILEDHFLPAYQLLIDGLEELKGTGSNENGLCWLKGGKDYYRYLLRSQSGLYEEPNQIRERLQEQLKADSLEMQSLLSENPELLSASLTARPALEDPGEILKALREQITEDFPSLSASSYEVKYVHPDLEEYLSPAFYLTPPVDTMSPNTIYINPAASLEGTELYTTLAHEGFPGHLYQTLYFAGTNPPAIRHIMGTGGYIEGWATYIESFAYGYAQKDPALSRLLWLNRSLNLGLCSLLDMGIHYYGWTEEDTFSFLSSFGITDRNAVKEIFRYTVETPGNYLKYYMGYLSILDLRTEMEKELGKNFDLKEFHRTVLEIGPCPFPVLRKYTRELLLS